MTYSTDYDKIAKENMDSLVRSGWLEKNLSKYVSEESKTETSKLAVFFFIVGIIGILTCAGLFFYYVSVDKFKTETQLSCPDVTIPEIKCPTLPSIPSCPQCPTCPQINPNINVKINGTG